MRLNFEFNDAQVESLNALKQKTGAASMKDLFNNALTMLAWAVDEAAQGKEIEATDGKTSRVFVTPLLRQVRTGATTGQVIMDAVDKAVKEGRSVAIPEDKGDQEDQAVKEGRIPERHSFTTPQ
jgi:hypothetical protein